MYVRVYVCVRVCAGVRERVSVLARTLWVLRSACDYFYAHV